MTYDPDTVLKFVDGLPDNKHLNLELPTGKKILYRKWSKCLLKL